MPGSYRGEVLQSGAVDITKNINKIPTTPSNITLTWYARSCIFRRVMLPRFVEWSVTSRRVTDGCRRVFQAMFDSVQ